MKVGHWLVLSSIILIGIGFFLFLQKSNVIDIIQQSGTSNIVDALKLLKNQDLEPQKPLANPPAIIKAIYATSWSAGNEQKLKYLIKLIKETELNAIVIDVKDYSGYVAYKSDLELPQKYNAADIRIPKFNALIKRFHDENIYVIARIAVFQDPRLALARPDLALYSSTTNQVWKDGKGLSWMDPAAKDVWDYNVAIAKEVLARGVDEVNLDYVRFASDGNLKDIRYPVWNEKTLKTHVINDFFKYVRQQLLEGKVSADLFGLVTVDNNGLGIGQKLEFALPQFDAIAPMVYPSHYFNGFNGYQNPANFPYEVIRYSMDHAVQKIKDFQIYASTTPVRAKLRPWIQDFDLGAHYDAKKIRAEIQAWDDAASNTPQLYGGWMVWNPANVYTKDALKPAPVAVSQ